MSEFSQAITNSNNDARESTDGSVLISGSSFLMDAADKIAVWRYTGVTIPQGYKIVSAVMAMKNFEAAINLSPNVQICCEDADSAAALSTTAYSISNRNRTSSPVTWNATVAQYHNTPNFASAVQKVVDRAGWASGNDLLVMLVALSGCDYRPMFITGGWQVTLTIVYGEGHELELTGELAATGAPVRRPGKRKAGVLSAAATLVRRPGKRAAGVLSAAATLVRRPGKRAAGVLSAAATAMKQTAMATTGTLSGTGAAARAMGSSSNPSTSHLVAYWPLDEESGTRYDAHGDLDLSDENTVGAAAGLLTNAADFERDSSEFLSITDTAALKPGDSSFTLAAWVKFESVNAFQTIASKWDETDDRREYRLAVNSTNSGRLQVSSDGTSGGVASAQTAAGAVTTGQWYLMVGWYDAAADELGFQMNNGTVYTASLAGGAYESTAPFLIGGQQAGESAAAFVDGLVDEAAFFSRALTAPERAWLYNNSVGRTYAELSTAALIPQALAGALSAAGGLARRAGKAPAGVLDTAGSLAAALNKGLAGSLSAAGGLGRWIGAGRTGTLSAAGEMVKLPDKQLAGSLSAAGEASLLRAFLLVLEGAWSSAGSLVKQAMKLPAGVLAASGTVEWARSVFRALAGEISAAGALARRSTHEMAGSLSAFGAAERARVALLTLAGSLAAAGGLAREMGKRAAGSLSAAGGLFRRTSRGEEGELSAAGELGRVGVALRALAGSLSAAGEAVRLPAKSLAGSLAAAGGLARHSTRELAGTLAASGASGRARAYLVSLAGSLSAAAGLARMRFKAGMTYPVVRLVVQARGFVRWKRGVGVIDEDE